MKLKLLPFFIAATILSANAQTYTFTQTTGTYTNLTGSISVNQGQEWDDDIAQIPLGFNFSMFQQTFNSIFITDSYFLHDTSTTIPYLNAGSVFLADLLDRGYGSGVSQSPISYLTTGTVGSRIFKCEWRNAGFYDDTNEMDYISFQLWLYETSNIMEVHIGQNSVTNGASYSGETGAGIGPIKYNVNTNMLDAGMMLTGTPSAATANSISSPINPFLFISGTPANGTIYRFSPISSSIGENSAAEVFVLYPNPAVNELTIYSQANYYNNVTLQIKNQLGQVLISEVENLSASGTTLNISHLPPGVYYIDGFTNDGNKILAQKIIKTK
jgi:hypothetical protein